MARLIKLRHCPEGAAFDTRSAILWNRDGGFSLQRATWVPTGGAMGNTAGDLTGNGRPEVVFNNTRSGHFRDIHNYVYLGNDRAEYGVHNRLELPTNSGEQAAIADLDLDGFSDLIFLDSEYRDEGWQSMLRIYPGGPDGPQPQRRTRVLTHPVLQDLKVADFDRDGFLDVLAVSQVYDQKPETLAKCGTIHYGSREGFKDFRTQSFSAYGNNSLVADVNRDGFLDILFNIAETSSSFIWATRKATPLSECERCRCRPPDA